MIENKRIILVAHYLLYGAAHALSDYLQTKQIERLLCMYLPLVSQRNTYIVEYTKTKQNLLKKVQNKILPRSFNLGMLDYFIDILQTICVVTLKEKYDVYIGFDPLNCLSGLFLKRIGKVKKVIFYSIDFVPIRFKNSLINTLYHKVEIFCVKNADEVWNVSPRIAEGREKFLQLSRKTYSQYVVPIGVWNKKVIKRQFRAIKKHQILFLGHLLEKQGVQMVLEALPLVIKKIPDVQFVIVGGGEYLNVLKQIVKELSLESYVIFTGWVKERKVIDEMMSESAVAIATYKPEKKQLYNFTYYADPTKLKDYLSAGLPIILTDVSYNASEIAEKGCGILVQYEKHEIAKALLTLLVDERKLLNYRENALVYAKTFDWSEIFKKVTI